MIELVQGKAVYHLRLLIGPKLKVIGRELTLRAISQKLNGFIFFQETEPS